MTNDEIRMTKSSDHQDFPAPQRPKLWLLRTRRFWFGVGILVLLISLWLGSGAYSADFYVRLDSKSGKENCVCYYFSSAQEGTLLFLRSSELGTSGTYYGSLKPWGYDFEKSSFELTLFPIVYSHWPVNLGASSTITFTKLSLPLWLPVLLWLIVWPLWIRRLTRKEAAHFAKLQ
jgi:hypothetical protein